jgi:hypothetical protein
MRSPISALRMPLFSLDTLVDTVAHVGFEVDIKLSRRRAA